MFKNLKKHHPNLYSILIGAAIIMYWRGIWGILDLYLFPNSEPLSYAVSIGVGLGLLYLNDFRLKEIE